MGKGSAPEPTDPQETAAAQTGTNVSTAITNAMLGNVNQVTPDGSLSYDQTGSYQFTDPYTGESYDVPTFTATQTLSEQQQAIKDQGDAANLNLATLANNQSSFLNDYMAEPFSYDSGDHETWALSLYDSLNADNIASNQEAMRTRLANQGIAEGSDAYMKAMQGLTSGQQNARDQFLLDSYQTGFSTAQAERNQPINEITALLSGSQVSNPNYVSTSSPSVATTDVASIIANNDAQQMNAWQQNQAAIGSTIGALGSLFALSDERAKTDKKKIGETKDGMGLFSFKYKGDDRTQIGLMAQDVAKKKPDAVAKGPGGLMMVDYEKALR